jgi:hypothetical protein
LKLFIFTGQSPELVTFSSLTSDVEIVICRQFLRGRRNRLPETTIPESASLDRRRVDVVRAERVAVERIQDFVVSETL